MIADETANQLIDIARWGAGESPECQTQLDPDVHGDMIAKARKALAMVALDEKAAE